MSVKLTWKIAPEPTGQYRSFEKRPWPKAYFSGGDKPAVSVSCSDRYTLEKAKSGEHAPLVVSVADWSVSKCSFSWIKIKRNFATMEEVKKAVILFFDHNPHFLPKEVETTSKPVKVEVSLPRGASKEYPSLGATFMRGTYLGQLKSVHADKDKNLPKVRDFIQAIRDRTIKIDETGLSDRMRDKYMIMLEDLFELAGEKFPI